MSKIKNIKLDNKSAIRQADIRDDIKNILLQVDVESKEVALKYLYEMDDEVKNKITQLADDYSRVIDSKSLFEEFKTENIQELIEYRDRIGSELMKIKKIHIEIKNELSNGLLENVIKIFDDLLNLKNKIKEF